MNLGSDCKRDVAHALVSSDSENRSFCACHHQAIGGFFHLKCNWIRTMVRLEEDGVHTSKCSITLRLPSRHPTNKRFLAVSVLQVIQTTELSVMMRCWSRPFSGSQIMSLPLSSPLASRSPDGEKARAVTDSVGSENTWRLKKVWYAAISNEGRERMDGRFQQRQNQLKGHDITPSGMLLPQPEGQPMTVKYYYVVNL